MAAKITPKKGSRRKALGSSKVVNIPAGLGNRFNCLTRLSQRELTELARKAGIGICKNKNELATRLAACEAVSIGVTTEAVVFDRPA